MSPSKGALPRLGCQSSLMARNRRYTQSENFQRAVLVAALVVGQTVNVSKVTILDRRRINRRVCRWSREEPRTSDGKRSAVYSVDELSSNARVGRRRLE